MPRIRTAPLSASNGEAAAPEGTPLRSFDQQRRMVPVTPEESNYCGLYLACMAANQKVPTPVLFWAFK